MGDVTFLVGLIGSTVRRTWLQNMRMVRTDDNGYLEVIAPAGAMVNVNLDAIEGNNVPQGGVNGMLPVMGDVGDNVAVTASWPVKIGAVSDAVLSAVADARVVNLVTDLYRRLYTNPQGGVADDAADDASNPVKVGGVADAVLALVADGDRVQFVTDLYRRLWTVIAGYDSGSNANRTFEIAPLNLQVLEESLVDAVNHAASAGISYPSDDGLVMMGYSDFSITGKFICGADNTVTMTVEGTNDEDATPANRDWIVLYAYRTDTNTVVNSIACGAAATVTYGWDFDNCNYRYIRVRLVIVNGGVLSNTVIIKIRRKAL
jgi:hypothetical protein